MALAVSDIIKIIAREYKDYVGDELGSVQMVKLFYLLECLFFGQHGRRLTGVRWIYYHYGPYAMEIADAIANDPELYRYRKELPRGRAAKIIRIRNDEEQVGHARDSELIDLPDATENNYIVNEDEEQVRRVVSPIVAQWGTKNLADLLDYVYFETAPMRDAVRGQLLEIERCLDDLQRPRLPKEFPRLNKKKLLRARNLLADVCHQRDPVLRADYLPLDDADLLRAESAIGDENG